MVNDLSELKKPSHRCEAGGGNASIRPFQCGPHWRAAGVPTGTYERGPHYMGYSTLDERVIGAVVDSIAQIDRLLVSGRFTGLAFSWNDETKLGGQIFDTAQVVRDHIVAGLEAVVAKHNVALIRSQFAGAGRDGDFNYMITRQSEVLFVFNDNEEQFYAHYNDSGNPYGASAGLQQQ
jgi:hypothetical protein